MEFLEFKTQTDLPSPPRYFFAWTDSVPVMMASRSWVEMSVTPAGACGVRISFIEAEDLGPEQNWPFGIGDTRPMKQH